MDLFSGIPNLSFTILPMFSWGKVEYNQFFKRLEYRPTRHKFHPISYNMRHRSALAIIFAHHSFTISAVWQPHGQLVPLTAQVHHRAIHLKTIWSPKWPTICWTWCAFLPACSPMRKKRISNQWGSSFSFLCCLSSQKNYSRLASLRFNIIRFSPIQPHHPPSTRGIPWVLPVWKDPFLRE